MFKNLYLVIKLLFLFLVNMTIKAFSYALVSLERWTISIQQIDQRFILSVTAVSSGCYFFPAAIFGLLDR